MSDPVRFGEILARRRGELGINQAKVPAHGGPSDLTVRKLEGGRVTRPSAETFAKLDKAMQWEPGSARRAFHGGEPTALAAQQDGDSWRTLRPPTAVVGIDQGVVLRTDALAELLRLSTALDALQGLSAQDVDRVTALRHALDRIIRAWVIRQAEVARVRGEISDLTIVLDDQLRSPPTALAPEDLEDLRYLRWLTNYEVDGLTDVDVSRFRERFDASTG